MDAFLQYYVGIEVLLPAEAGFLRTVLSWMCAENGVDSTQNAAFCKAMGSLALSMYPTRYFVHQKDFSPVLRKLLSRYVDVCEMFLHASGQEVVIMTDDVEDLPQDIFTADKMNETEMHVYGITASGSKDGAVGTVSGWAYHCLLNGFIHPLTREPLLNMGKIAMDVPPVVVDSFPMLTLAQVDQLKMIDTHYEEPELLSKHEGYDGLHAFEKLYGIPADRAFSLQFLDSDSEDEDGQSEEAEEVHLDEDAHAENGSDDADDDMEESSGYDPYSSEDENIDAVYTAIQASNGSVLPSIVPAVVPATLL